MKRVVQRNPESGQIEVVTIEIMRRQVHLAASNYLVQSAALASRLLINVGVCRASTRIRRGSRRPLGF